MQLIIVLHPVGEQELRNSSNMIFHQEVKDCVVDKEVKLGQTIENQIGGPKIWL